MAKRKKCKGECGEVLPLSAYHKRTSARDGRQSICKACMAELKRRKKEEQTGQSTAGVSGRPAGSGSVSPKVVEAAAGSLDVSDSQWSAILAKIVERAAEGHPKDMAIVAQLKLQQQSEDVAGGDPGLKGRRAAKLVRLGLREIRRADPDTFYDRGLELLDRIVEMGPEAAAAELGIEIEEAA